MQRRVEEVEPMCINHKSFPGIQNGLWVEDRRFHDDDVSYSFLNVPTRPRGEDLNVPRVLVKRV